jgi:hypothetical protein
LTEYFIELDEGKIEVTGPSGAKFTVMNEDEEAYFNSIAEKYLSDNYFTNISDLQDLDRVLIMETMVNRWNLWISMEMDYLGNNIDIADAKKSVNDYSKELRLLKKSLSMDKVSRDKDKGESIAEYIKNLGIYAKQMGIMREEQAAKAITLWQELKGLITYHNNCLPDEQKEYKITEHDIILWIQEVMPEFDAIDAYFREHKQQYWIRDV